MSTIVKEIYEAFIEAGVSKETAGKVADSLSESIEKFVRKDDNNLSTREDLGKVREDITHVETQIKMLMWMMGGGVLLLFIQNLLIG